MNRSKFNVSKDTSIRTVDGIVFDSEAESRFYRFLRDQIGTQYFCRQPRFELTGRQRFRDPFNPGKPIKLFQATFSPDFIIGGPFPPEGLNTSFEFRPWQIVVDIKGMVMNDYQVRSKWFSEKYGAPVMVIKGRSLKNWLQYLPAFQRAAAITKMRLW